MSYTVSFKNKAIKSLEKIPKPYYANIKQAIYGLQEDPRPSGCKKLKGRDAYRIRVADYRVIYEIEDDVLVVQVIDVGHRKEVYWGLEACKTVRFLVFFSKKHDHKAVSNRH